MKELFRDFCGLYTEHYLRNIIHPVIKQCQELEAVLIEFRPMPQVEFIIRNAIIKLGSDWSFTVICGNLNYDMFNSLCDFINPNIKVIKLDYDNLDVNGYNNVMLTSEIWNVLTGRKILIYQEDSFIFNYNINDFLEWDYIGAPWPLHQKENKNQVGNGGFSLRTLEIMKQIVNNNTFLKKIDYKWNNLEKCPEDVFFSTTMINFNLGKVADHETAKRFSIESIYSECSLGGHCFWLCDPYWKKRLHKTVIQFKKNSKHIIYEHRGGWSTVLNYLETKQFYNNDSDYMFFDLLEHYFLFDKRYYCPYKWSGIIHCTPQTPDYLNCVNITFMFDNPNFIRSLDNCFLLITTCEYIRKYTIDQLKRLGKDLPVVSIKHPIEEPGIPFDIDQFNENGDKKLIQIGQQLRIMSSIYLVETPSNFSKMWLTGTRDKSHIDKLINNEQKNVNLNTVKRYYTDTFEEYDTLLSKNIVFVHLFDAAANNTILECIIRNTPVIVNRIEAVVEYLGPGYPLYFNTLDEVPALFDKITEGYNYLKNMNKTDITMNYFHKTLLTAINYSLNGRSLDLMPVYQKHYPKLKPPEPEIIIDLQPFIDNEPFLDPELDLEVDSIVNSSEIILKEVLTEINYSVNSRSLDLMPVYQKHYPKLKPPEPKIIIDLQPFIDNEPFLDPELDLEVDSIVNSSEIILKEVLTEITFNFLEKIKLEINNKIIPEIISKCEYRILKNSISNKIIDSFIFYNEIDLLIYRLSVLNEIVDYFVIVESRFTFTGQPKELYYENNRHLFERFKDKIIHITLDDCIYKYPDIKDPQQWKNEIFQRNNISKGINRLKLNDHDLILISDVDEIPDPVTLKNIDITDLSVLEMDFYYYNLNTKLVNKWNHAKIVSYKRYKSFRKEKVSINDIRNITNCSKIKFGGWHLSYFGTAEFISNKITNFSHQEFNNKNYNNLLSIKNNIDNVSDIFNRPDEKIDFIDRKDNVYLPPDYQIYLKDYFK